MKYLYKLMNYLQHAFSMKMVETGHHRRKMVSRKLEKLTHLNSKSHFSIFYLDEDKACFDMLCHRPFTPKIPFALIQYDQCIVVEFITEEVTKLFRKA